MPEKKATTRAKLNPQVTDIEIGVRELRSIKVYPLSVGDQLELTDLISKALQQFLAKSDDMATDDIEFVTFVVDLIGDNIGKIAGLATEFEPNEILGDITNEQALQLAELIYTMNYESLVKNVNGLVKKIAKVFPLTRPSAPSSPDMEDIEQNTSSDDPSETEELPTEK